MIMGVKWGIWTQMDYLLFYSTVVLLSSHNTLTNLTLSLWIHAPQHVNHINIWAKLARWYQREDVGPWGKLSLERTILNYNNKQFNIPDRPSSGIDRKEITYSILDFKYISNRIIIIIAAKLRNLTMI